MRMNRYNAATGKREFLPEQARDLPEKREPPRPVPGRGRNQMDIHSILNRLSPQHLEQEDLLLMLILFLLWRESGDRELLIALGAFLFL